MAADTILVAGQRINRRALYVAGAIAVGVVGYAWWTRRPPELPPEAVTEGELDAMGDERVPITGVPYNPNFGAPDTGITDNASWSRYVTDRLQGLGYDVQAVSDAIGKFLDRKALTAAEANLVRAAIGQGGEPPVGRPWTVIETQPVASVGLLAPKNVEVRWLGWSGQVPMYRITWEAVSGATDYHVIAPNGTTFVSTDTSIDNIPGTPQVAGTAKVAGRNAAHAVGPYGTVTWTPGPLPSAPAPAPAPAPGPSAPAAPAWARAAGYRNAVAIAWAPVDGATGYQFVRIAGSSLDTPWVDMGNPANQGHVHPQNVSVDSHYAYAVRAYGPGGIGPPTMTNDVWILA